MYATGPLNTRIITEDITLMGYHIPAEVYTFCLHISYILLCVYSKTCKLLYTSYDNEVNFVTKCHDEDDGGILESGGWQE